MIPDHVCITSGSHTALTHNPQYIVSQCSTDGGYFDLKPYSGLKILFSVPHWLATICSLINLHAENYLYRCKTNVEILKDHVVELG